MRIKNYLYAHNVILYAFVIIPSNVDLIGIESKYDIDELTKFYDLIDDITPYCRNFMINYKAALNQIEQCILKYTNPIHYCQRCIDQFIIFNQSYYHILENAYYSNNSLGNSTLKTCEAQILQADRVQTLTRSFNFINELWNAANCYDCFTFYKDECSGKTYSYSLSNETYKFYEYYYEFVQCENNFSRPQNDNHSKDIISFCNYCSGPYIKLSKFYITKSSGETNSICVDLSDLMNNTYFKWKDYYNCKAIRTLNIPFLTIQIFILILPVFFYVGAYLHSSKKESIIVEPNRLKDFLGKGKQTPQGHTSGESATSPYTEVGFEGGNNDENTKPRNISLLCNSSSGGGSHGLSSFSAPSRSFLSRSSVGNDNFHFDFPAPRRVTFLDDYNDQKLLHDIEEAAQEFDDDNDTFPPEDLSPLFS